MPGLSRHITSLSPSPTISLNTKAKALRDSGKDVINFSVGEPDFDTPAVIVEAGISGLQEGLTRYGPAGGGPALRKAITDKLARENGLSYQPENIVVGIGAKELLFHIFLAILNEGDEAILFSPAWVSYKEQIKAAGATPVFIPFADIDDQIAALDQHITSKTKAVVLCSPSNPSGAVLTSAQLQKLADKLVQRDIWVISDEIYEYMVFEQEHQSILNVCEQLKDRTILVNGLSKGFAMTGWRVGYIAACDEVAKLVRRLQGHSSTCLPPFIEKAAVVAVQQGKQLMADAILDLKERRDFVIKLAKQVPAISWVEPQGAFYLFVDIRRLLEQSRRNDVRTSLEFSEYLLETFQVAAVPGEAFDCPGFIRFSYATSRETIADGFDRFKKAAETLQA